jgi:hypothetical protein
MQFVELEDGLARMMRLVAFQAQIRGESKLAYGLMATDGNHVRAVGVPDQDAGYIVILIKQFGEFCGTFGAFELQGVAQCGNGRGRMVHENENRPGAVTLKQLARLRQPRLAARAYVRALRAGVDGNQINAFKRHPVLTKAIHVESVKPLQKCLHEGAPAIPVADRRVKGDLQL